MDRKLKRGGETHGSPISNKCWVVRNIEWKWCDNSIIPYNSQLSTWTNKKLSVHDKNNSGFAIENIKNFLHLFWYEFNFDVVVVVVFGVLTIFLGGRLYTLLQKIWFTVTLIRTNFVWLFRNKKWNNKKKTKKTETAVYLVANVIQDLTLWYFMFILFHCMFFLSFSHHFRFRFIFPDSAIRKYTAYTHTPFVAQQV